MWGQTVPLNFNRHIKSALYKERRELPAVYTAMVDPESSDCSINCDQIQLPHTIH